MVVIPQPVRSRWHTSGTDSARGLLFTILGELVLPGGGAAWTSALIDASARLGVEEKATRQALMRTAEKGWLTSERAGRRTRWRLTGIARDLLVEGADRIYNFRAVAPDWNGQWLIVLARTPESERTARHVLRTRLTWAGLGSPAPGVWISPHTDRLAAVVRALDEAGLSGEAQAFTASHAGVGEVRVMVRSAWDLDELALRYEQFRAEFRARRAVDPLAAVLELVHAWRPFPWVDPTLPSHLLPKGWPGRAAAALFARAHARWSEAARAQWRELNA